MKVVIFNNTGLIEYVYKEIHEPKIDKKDNIIYHNNGKIYGFKENNRDFVIVDDDVEAVPMAFMSERLYKADKSSEFDKSFTEKVKDGLEEVKEGIKDIFDSDDDGDNHDPNHRDFYEDDK